MAKNNNFNVRVQTKRDTSSNWTRLNPILLDGEIIIVDTAEGDVRLKVGNGTSVYTALPFLDEYIDFPIPDVSGQIAIHNEDENSHQDIRASVIQALADAKEYTDDIIENFGSGVIISPDEPTKGDVWIDTDAVIEIEESGVVLSFNGRDGDVLPEDGDYTAEMVGADKAGAADAALADAKAYTDAQIATIPTPDVSGQISVHNEDENSHQDIRISVTQALTDAKEYTDDAIGNIGPGVAVSAEEPTEENIWIDIDDNPDDEYDVVLTFNGRVGEIVPQTGDYTAEMVGADVEGSAAKALEDAKVYADEKIANLLDNSTEAVDSIMELADAMKNNADAITALETIAGNKVSVDEMNAAIEALDILPTITADDNGKVIGVVNGQFALVTPKYPVVTQDGTVLTIV